MKRRNAAVGRRCAVWLGCGLALLLAGESAGEESNAEAETSLLWRKPFEPLNRELFPVKAYGGGEAAPREYPEAAKEVRAELAAWLEKLHQAGAMEAGAAAQTLERFDDPALREIVTAGARFEGRLLASVLLLAGTSAREVLPALLEGSNATGKPPRIIFTNLPPTGLAKSAVVEQEGNKARRWVIALNGGREGNPQLRGEPLPVLAAILAHEALHQDNQQGEDEEIAAKWVEKVVWAELVLADPELVGTRTTVVRMLNLELLMWLNSGAELPFPGLTRAPVERPILVAPGAAELLYESYGEFLRRELYAGEEDAETPANRLLAALLPGPAGAIAPPAFGKELLAHIEGLRPFEPAELMTLLKILQLRPHRGTEAAGE